MNRKKIYTKLLLTGSLIVMSGALSSCNDFLTILPTDQIPEENFWQDKTDLDGVLAGAYEKLSQSGLTSQIIQWGEIRSDNLAQNDMSQTDITLVQSAVLQPTNSIFDWSGFYTGINYCNQVLEKGYAMTEPGQEIDPSFTRTDYNSISEEMLALRALYYFYLVRAYRDVPYITEAYYSDQQATVDYPAQTPGVAILGDCIDTLEAHINYAVKDYGNDADNKGRFTRRGVKALLADMYLWRACLLKNYVSKPNLSDGRVNLTDVANTNEDGTQTEGYKTADGTAITDAYCNELSTTCLNKSVEYATEVINEIKEDYDEYIDRMGNQATSDERTQPYPLYLNTVGTGSSIQDNVYYYNFGLVQNSRESVLELQYDGTSTSNSTINTYFSTHVNSVFTAKYMTLSNSLVAGANSVNPEVGFGMTDFRLLETCYYASSESNKPIHKFYANSIYIPDYKDVGTDNISASVDYRTSQMDAHWPIYRLADMMLIKAEAIARLGTTDGETLREGFRLVNQLFKRNNPALVDDISKTTDEKYVCDRVSDTYGNKSTTDATFSKTADELLQLVYRERQREFVAEGKRWFDIVRLAEAAYDPSDSKNVKNVVSNYISLKTSVSNRLTSLWGYYCPIYSEEIKINGVENGGKLVQNPVWERYTKK